MVMRNMSREDRIDRYVKHEMDAAERAAFEQQMATSSELREQVALTRAIRRSLAVLAERRKRMEAMERDFLSRHPDCASPDVPPVPLHLSEQGRRRWLVPAVSGVVASVLVAWLAVAPQHYVAAPSENPAMPVCRSASDALPQIDSLILRQQWQQAAALVRQARADTLSDAAASPEERNYVRLLVAQRAYELDWRTAQILLGQQRRAEADRLLRRLANRPGVHQKEAFRLLRGEAYDQN